MFPQLPPAPLTFSHSPVSCTPFPAFNRQREKNKPREEEKKGPRRANPRLLWRRRNPNSPSWIGPGKGLLPQIGAPPSSDSIRQLNLAPIRGWIFSPPAASLAPFFLDPSAIHKAPPPLVYPPPPQPTPPGPRGKLSAVVRHRRRTLTEASKDCR